MARVTADCAGGENIGKQCISIHGQLLWLMKNNERSEVCDMIAPVMNKSFLKVDISINIQRNLFRFCQVIIDIRMEVTMAQNSY